MQILPSEEAGGFRYIKARRPDLYADIIGQVHESEQKVVWFHADHPQHPTFDYGKTNRINT